jgi:hypothetical protein
LSLKATFYDLKREYGLKEFISIVNYPE